MIFKLKVLINKKGQALLLVMTSVVIITLMIVELGYNARISSSITANYKEEVVATYLAKSSVNVALLRLAIVSKMKSFDIGGISIPKEVLSMFITMPFIFPPPAEMLAMAGIGGEMDLGMQELLNQIKKESNIGSVGRFEHMISSDDSKININIVALDDEKAITFKEQMKNLYSAKVLSDESFAYRYSMDDLDVLLNNILDWIDSDVFSRNGGDEARYYQRKTPPYKPRNAAIPTMSELNMIEGMNDEIFELVTPMITVFSGKGLNVNKMDKTMWKTMDNRFSDEEIELLMERLQLADFADEKELRSWIGENTKIPATEFNPLKISLAFDDENFKIEATGYSGRVSKKMVVYVSSTYRALLSGESIPEGQAAKAPIKPDAVYWEIK